MHQCHSSDSDDGSVAINRDIASFFYMFARASRSIVSYYFQLVAKNGEQHAFDMLDPFDIHSGS